MILTRFAYLPEGTIGVIQIPQGPRIYTIERPWQDNEPYYSCIPEGEYPLEWDTTGRIKDVPRLRGTEPRTQINIHAANHPEELHGCIAPNLRWTVEGQTPRGINSRAALALLIEQFSGVKRDTVQLRTREDLPAVLTITSLRAT
jgi:hypothetical protein